MGRMHCVGLAIDPNRGPVWQVGLHLLDDPCNLVADRAQIASFHATFGARACRAQHLSLFRLEHGPEALRAHILAQHVVYVGGGSMRNLLAIWREHGLDRILREAWEAGVVLAGLSAGAMCWFEHGITCSTGSPAPAPGLGFLRGSLSVHYDAQPARRPVGRRG